VQLEGVPTGRGSEVAQRVCPARVVVEPEKAGRVDVDIADRLTARILEAQDVDLACLRNNIEEDARVRVGIARWQRGLDKRVAVGRVALCGLGAAVDRR